ncbi:MAG: 30S ribosomal protein S20 [Spirochaetota bacterium]|nr:30S ribosomal protein S20 [Spirochaetota bacterium]
MPNIKSAKTRVKQTEKKYMRNKAIRTFIRHLRRNTTTVLTAKTLEVVAAQLQLNEFKKQIDRAWAKGVLSRNTSSRIKSSMEVLFKNSYSLNK